MNEHILICRQSGVRLDKFLADSGLELSRSAAVGMIDNGNVTVNGDVNVVKTGTSDVHCNNAVKVSTGTGNVHCDTITGSVSTGMGNIYHNK